jgi:hypothetical protein
VRSEASSLVRNKRTAEKKEEEEEKEAEIGTSKIWVDQRNTTSLSIFYTPGNRRTIVKK